VTPPERERPPSEGERPLFGDIPLTEEERRLVQSRIEVLFSEEDWARNLLDRMEFPSQQIPRFQNARLWWSSLFRQFDHGAIQAPYRRLLRAVLQTYPWEPTLRPLAERHGIIPLFSSLCVQGTGGTEHTIRDVPAAQRVRDLGAELTERIYPDADPRAGDVYHRQADGSWLGINADDSLYDAGVRDGDRLLITVVMLGRAADLLREDEAIAKRLGFPVAEETKAGPSPRGTRGRLQRFNGGTVYSSKPGEAVPVWGEIGEYHKNREGVSGVLGFPVSGEMAAGTHGVYQRFEAREDYPADVLERLPEDARWGATVYFSEKHGTHSTQGRIGVLYERMGGTTGDLGFPVSNETEAASGGAGYRLCQRFEGGTIYWWNEYGAVAETGAVASLLDEDDAVREQLGFPVSSPQPLHPSSDDVIQFFERGAVTVTAGEVERWPFPKPVTANSGPVVEPSGPTEVRYVNRKLQFGLFGIASLLFCVDLLLALILNLPLLLSSMYRLGSVAFVALAAVSQFVSFDADGVRVGVRFERFRVSWDSFEKVWTTDDDLLCMKLKPDISGDQFRGRRTPPMIDRSDAIAFARFGGYRGASKSKVQADLIRYAPSIYSPSP
jgi:hypothetical protein